MGRGMVGTKQIGTRHQQHLLYLIPIRLDSKMPIYLSSEQKKKKRGKGGKLSLYKRECCMYKKTRATLLERTLPGPSGWLSQLSHQLLISAQGKSQDRGIQPCIDSVLSGVYLRSTLPFPLPHSTPRSCTHTCVLSLTLSQREKKSFKFLEPLRN